MRSSSRVLSAAAVLAAVSCAAFLAHAKEVTLEIDDLQAPGFSAKALRANLSGPGLRELALEIGALNVAGRDWRKVKLTCPEAELGGGRIACARGVLHLDEKIPIAFSYATGRRDLSIELKPADEVYRVTGRVGAGETALQVRIDKGRLDRLAPLVPVAGPKLSAGRASGTIQMQGSAIAARLEIEGVAFADASGLHAGEKIGATIEADAAEKSGEWRWSARVAWHGGEVFWQPVFLAGKGHRVEVRATTARGVTRVENGRLELPGVGTVAFSGEWNHARGVLTAYEASASRIRVAGLYEDLLKPLAQGTAMSDLRADGEAGFDVRGVGGALAAAQLDLNNVSFEDRQRRFAVFGLTGRVPWRQGEQTTGELSTKGAEFLKVPVGGTRAPLRLRGTRVDIESMRVPVLDGAVMLRDFAAGMASDGWRWRFSGEVVPISMVQLTGAFGLPTMYGSVSGAIPELRYRRGTLSMDGALAVRAFDGVITASSVELIEPLGRAPRLHGDIEVKNMDLELLTRAFDFGTITGRIDARVAGLELSGWEPVRFDAWLASSAGTYPRKISQRAVQNISALGGAGAAAAIQRSLLRFFDQFGYEKLGLSCKLENGVCEMDGIERAPQGYVIVKGGGIPAISVLGYNRSVNWRELTERLKRITQENVKPIVK